MNCKHCGSDRLKKNGRSNGCQRYYCHDCRKNFNAQEEHRGNFVDKDVATIKTVSGESNSGDDLLVRIGIDPSVAEVIPMASNWGNTQKESASFRWRFTKEHKDKTFAENIQDLKIKPVKTKYKKLKKSDVASVITMTDLHLDKLEFTSRGVILNEIQKNIDKTMQAFGNCIEYAKLNGSNTVFFPIIGDWFHTNGKHNQTLKGTPQEVSIPNRAAFDIIVRLMAKMIETLRSEGFYVNLNVVRGNHDEDTMFKAMTTLDMYFKDCDDVNYSIDYFGRQYRSWGETLLMFAHGDHAKKNIQNIVGVIAQENRKLWANCTSTLCLFGDIHHTQEWGMKQTQKDHMSVLVKFLRSFCGADKWHHDNMYVGVPKTAYVHLIHKEEGYIGERLFNFY